MKYFKPGILMFTYALKRRFKGYKKYQGNFEQIAKDILKDCYKQDHFVVSNGHFQQFYCRDFGMITEALLKLGYKKEVFATILYALQTFKKYNKITTTIVDGKPIDYFSYGIDSLPFLMRSIRLALQHGMKKDNILHYKDFLEQQITYYYETVYDEKTLIKFQHFSSIKDNYSRPASSYDISAMLGLAIEINSINYILKKAYFKVPITINILKKQFKDSYWNGKFFYEDAWKKQHIASDANIFPFYWNIFDNNIRKIACKTLIKEGLDTHLPIQYRKDADSDGLLLMQRILAPGYEGTSIWLHLGLCYLEQLQYVDKKHTQMVLQKVVKMIEQQKTFVEVFTKDGRPYKSLFYYSDEAMSWIAGYLWLAKKHKVL